MNARPHRAGAPRAVVVGAHGFIGRHLVHALETRGHAVSGVTRQNSASVIAALSGGTLEARTVFYVAGSANPASAESDPSLAAADVSDFRHFVERVAVLKKPPLVVLAGSGGTVYDARDDPPYTEEDAVAPTTRYGRGKLAMERILDASEGIPAVVTRLANVYGPGQRTGTGQGVIAHWLAAALAGRTLDIFGDPGTSRDYVFVGDAVAAMVLIHETEKPLPRVFNVGSGSATSLAALADDLRAVIDDRDLSIREVGARGFDRNAVWLDTTLIERTLGWRANTRLKDGLQATWHAVRRTPRG